MSAFSITPDNRRCHSESTIGHGMGPGPGPTQRETSATRRKSDGDAGAILVGNNSNCNCNSNSNRTNSARNDPEDWKAGGKRGVRPRLDHLQCPVTQKNLLQSHNDASLASTSISSNTITTAEYMEDYYSSNENENEGDGDGDGEETDIELNENGGSLDRRKTDRLRRRTPKHYQDTPPSSSTRKAAASSSSSYLYSGNHHSPKLSTQIARFQKMVSDLESASKNPASSPEAAWKSRILLRSARDAERDLASGLASLPLPETNANTTGNANANATQTAACKKLARDFRRARDQLRSVVAAMERKQLADVSLLTASEAAPTRTTAAAPVSTAAPARGTASLQREEDFFDRAMRERNHEVRRISDSMKMVNEIYQDLAEMVDGQQEQVDRLEDLNEETKAQTRAGLEEIQHGMWKLCVADRSGNGSGLFRGRGTTSTALLDLSGSAEEDGSEGQHRASSSASTSQRKSSSSYPKQATPLVDPGELLNCMMCQVLPPRNNNNNNNNTSDSSSRHVRSVDVGAGSQQEFPRARPSPLRRLPPGLQESARDVYQRGHAVVGGIVEQVHEAVTSNSGSSALREVRDRMTCTPRPGDYRSNYYDDDDDDNDNDNNNDICEDAVTMTGTEPTARQGLGVGVGAGADDRDASVTDEENLLGKAYFQIEEHTKERSPRRSKNNRRSTYHNDDYDGRPHEQSHRQSRSRRDSENRGHGLEKRDRKHRRKSASRSTERIR